MNAGVNLVQAYLHLNGYFTITELPVIRESRAGYEEVTDLDVLAVRFPWASFTVPGGRPTPDDDVSLSVDTSLVPSGNITDVIIGEVKEGKARVNDTMRTRDALLTALRRVGCAPDDVALGLIDDLRQRGQVTLPARGGEPATRIRIVAFGTGKPGKRAGYEVVSLRQVAGFIERYLRRHHAVLKPSDLPEPALGILHLLNKLG